MKKNLLIFGIILMIFGINVKAETLDATIKITGRNDFGRELKIEKTCQNVDNCGFKNLKWYYNDTNSTEGGTEIQTEHEMQSNFYPSEDMIGKYIYVVATLGANGYDDVEVKAITSDSENNTGKVNDYIKVIDSHDYEIDVKAETGNAGSSISLTLKNIQEDNYNYYVYFTNDDNSPIIEQDNYGCKYVSESSKTLEYSKPKLVGRSGKISIDPDWYIINGYNNAYVLKNENIEGRNYCVITKNPIKIQKPSLPILTERYQFYIFANKNDSSKNYMATFPYFPTIGGSGSHELITKIGKVTDKKVLVDLKNNNYESLLKYAKEHDAVATYIYSDSDHEVNIGDLKVDSGSFYYIYTKYKNDDGLYRDIEGVTITQAKSYGLFSEIDWSSVEIEENVVPKEDKQEEAKTWEFEIKYEANGGEGTMKSETHKSGEAIVLKKNEFKKEKPKKYVFWGWNLYIEDKDGKREAVKDDKNKVIRFEEGSKVENIEVPEGYKLIAVAEWTPATGTLEIGMLIVGLFGLMIVGYKYTNKKKMINNI